MPRGHELSKHQRSIVHRYYEHLDTITIQNLAEISTELFLAGGQKTADRLWARAAAALAKTSAKDAAVARIVQSRDVEGLARLVNDLSTGKAAVTGRKGPTP